MTEFGITSLNAGGWWQVEETGPDGFVSPIGCFRTKADAQAWLNAYVLSRSGKQVFCARPEGQPGEPLGVI